MALASATRWSYARAGVDRNSIRSALDALLKEIRYTPPPSHGRPVRLPGHYAGLVRVGRETIAITTDTVGTKVLLAERLNAWEGVGEDIVGVNVNDLAAVGARPFGIVDILLCARPDTARFAAIGRGLQRGLKAAQCALLGGETAVVPDIVREIDLGGTAVGFFPRGRAPVTGQAIRPGDVILGLRSSGLHANGYTLVRKLLEEQPMDLAARRPGATSPLGDELLAPTRIYTPASEALAGLSGVHGFAHISGGGVRNLLRLRDRVGFSLDSWPDPAGLFGWLQSIGSLSDEELYQTFNVGIGFVIVVEPRRLAEIRRRLSRAGFPDALTVGRVTRGSGVELPQRNLRYVEY
jgi:phosphoribosylformylglycinamidine cyclo-ligase